MRIVKLSDLNEKEKEEYIKQSYEREQERIELKQQEREDANQKFNHLTKRNALPVVNKGKSKTTISRESLLNKEAYEMPTNREMPRTASRNISEAIKSGNYTKSKNNTNFDEFKKNLLPTLSKNILSSTAKDLGNNLSNTVLGLENGLISLQQQVSKNIQSPNKKLWEGIDKREKEFSEKNNLAYESPEEKMKRLLGNNYKKPFTPLQEIIDNKKEDNTLKIQQNIESTDNPILRKTAELMPSVGQMLPGGVLPGAAGAVYFTGSASGNYYDEAKQRGMNEDEATLYSGIMGVVEGLTEKINFGRFMKGGKDVAKNAIGKAFREFGLGALENAVQEAVIEPIDETVRKIVGGDKYAEYDLTKAEEWQRLGSTMLASGIDGALSAIIMSGISGGVGSAVNLKNKIQNNQTITAQEVNSFIEDCKDNGIDVNKIVKQNIQQSTENLINQDLNNKNAQIQQTILPLNKTSQNQISEQINQDIENGQEMLYNKTESESGINGEVRREGMERLPGQLSTRLQQNSEQKQIQKYTKQQYEQFEKEIKPIKSDQLTNEQVNLQKKYKRQYQKDVVFFDAIKSSFRGGASLTDPNKIFVDINSANDFGYEMILNHELMESDIRHNRVLSDDIIQPTIKKIIDDPNFEEQKLEFWKEQEGEIPSDYLIAKDILCDRFAELKTGEKLDYQNVLSQETNMSLDYSLETFQKEINKQRSNSKAGVNLPLPNKNMQDIKLPAIEDMSKMSGKNNTTLITKKTRHEVIQNYRKLAEDNLANISKWKDKSSGFRYQRETMERNMYDIMPKEDAKKMIETYFEPIHQKEAKKQRFINSYNEKIQELNLNKYESEAVQLLGEQKYNPSFDKDEAKETIQSVQENINNGKINKQKVNNAIELFRNIYDELFELENQVLRKNGYQEKPYLKGYFPHFIDYVPETRADKILDKLGFKIDKRALPTDIAGITEQFVPGKTWNKSALERKTNKTDYNALKGFDTYIQQAADNIFHTENIQKLRALENEIRYQYSDKGIQERIDKIRNNETLDIEEKQKLMDNIFEQVKNPLPNLVTQLREYTNNLANKKSQSDREIEKSAGRKIYNTVNAIENRFAANATGLNVSSALTNFIPITQAWSQISSKNLARATLDTIKNNVPFVGKNDGFVDSSDFLTNRLRKADKLYKTNLEKISEKANILFDGIDETTSNILVRGKYLDNIEKGMSNEEAIKNADRFAANVMADRSKGALPIIFNKKNPFTKMFTQFQLEVNNQYSYMFKDLPRDLKDKGLGAIALAFFKMFLGAWIYNEVSEELTGRRAAFDPIDIVKTTYGTITDEKEKTANKIISIGENIAQELPFVGGLFGGGRIPISGALPDPKNLIDATAGLATGEMNPKKALSTLGKEVMKPAMYLLPPFAGGQLKKTIEGIDAVNKGGSYNVDKNGNEILQFPIENPTARDYLKAGVFGKYALPTAKDYINNNFKSLTAKQTEGYKKVQIPYKEFLEYTNSGAKTKEEKINYISNMNISTEKKWNMYNYDVLSNEIRNEDNSSQQIDAEYAIKLGITSKKEYMDLYAEATKSNIEMPKFKDITILGDNNIKLKNYMNYKIECKEAEQNLEENKSLKTSDKVQILLNSDVTNKEKGSIYKNFVNKEDKDYELIEKQEIPIDEYLKLKTQNFLTDKDEDGKSISGSKKMKVIKYINSLKLNVLQKAILINLEGYKDYNSLIKENIQDKKILKELGIN